MSERAVEIARAWIGTPYVHQGSACRAGADCLGLVRGVWRGLYGAEHFVANPLCEPANIAGVFNMGGVAVANYVSVLERIK